MALNYNPTVGSGHDNMGINSGITDQLNPYFILRNSITRARKLQFFMPLSDVTKMPKHYGKTVKVYEYVPLLDLRNVNNQGIDANGVTLDGTKAWVNFPEVTMVLTGSLAANISAIQANGDITATSTGTTVGSYTILSLNKRQGLYSTVANANSAANVVPGAYVTVTNGNLYGSSRDVGAITGRLPVLTENGGRVNRVGFTRIQREATLASFGLFYEFTRESIDFDSDSELMSHLATELMNGVTQLTEAALQIDLINAAGSTVVWPGSGTVAKYQLTGNTTDTDDTRGLVDIGDLISLDQILTDNRCPLQTTVITGSRNIDTKTIPDARIMFVGNEIVPRLRAMKDLFGNPAFIPVQQYAAAGTPLNGEVGTIHNFRIVQVPEMLNFAGAGGVVATNGGYRATANPNASGSRYDVFPMVVVGDDAFTTIGFQTDGKTVKFEVITKMPGAETAYAASDPYGRTGFSSIQWYYATLIKRPERIGVIYTIAPK